jgi:hypothetical protein
VSSNARGRLGGVFRTLASRGVNTVVTEIDDTNDASLGSLVGLGARPVGGSVEMVRPGCTTRRRVGGDGPAATGRDGRLNPPMQVPAGQGERWAVLEAMAREVVQRFGFPAHARIVPVRWVNNAVFAVDTGSEVGRYVVAGASTRLPEQGRAGLPRGRRRDHG